MKYSQEWLPLGNQLDEVSDILNRLDDTLPPYSRHYSQNEDFFLRLQQTITIPSLPIHHSVYQQLPSETLKEGLRETVENITRSLPGLFYGLQYYFNPLDPLRMTFFRLHQIEGRHYLYLLKVDLSFRPTVHQLITQGSNDLAPAYSTDQINLEADIIPLKEVSEAADGLEAQVNRSISDTWIGETGRGYFVQGIWIDRDLTKFFSKLILPTGQKTHPYYPVTCKYQAVCSTVIEFNQQKRQQLLTDIHRWTGFIELHIDQIQSALHRREFSATMPLLTSLREKLPDDIHQRLAGFVVKAYLNQHSHKEYELIDATE